MTAPEGVAARLDELERLYAAATPGPWRQDGTLIAERFDTVADCWETEDDAALIVAAVTALPDLIAAVRAVAERHRPWYEIKGVRHDNTVTVPCTDFADCDGTFEHDCAASDGDGHEVLACYECRCVVEYDIDGFLLWPCPTVRALTSALSGRDNHTERQPCGCKSVYVHDHGCTKFASDHTEEAGR